MTEETDRLAALTAPHTTVADKIRALDAAGVPRADIARFLGKRYQHVRNVLEGDAQSGGYVLGRADLSGVQERGAAFEGKDDDEDYIDRRRGGAYWLKVKPDGSLPIPLEIAEALDAGPGEKVFVTLEKDGSLRLISADAALKEAQALVRRYIPEGVNLADSFIADRIAEAEREAADD